MKSLKEVREKILGMRAAGVSWKNPLWKSEFPKCPRGTLVRIATDPTYVPRRDKTRNQLDLPEVTLVEKWEGYKVRHERLNKGVKKPKKVRCPHCQEVFGLSGNIMKKEDDATL